MDEDQQVWTNVNKDMEHRHAQAMLRMALRAAVAVVALLVALMWARCSEPVHKTDAYDHGYAKGYSEAMNRCHPSLPVD